MKTPKKNTLRPILLVLTAVAALSVAYPAKANLIPNPGFETGDFTGWAASTAGTASASVQGTFGGIAPHSGNFQAVVGLPDSNAAAILVSQFFTTPGTTYTVDFFLALSGQGSIGVTFGIVPIFTHTFSSGFGYTEYTFNVTASTNANALQFAFANGQAATLFLDDVSVNPAVVGVPDGGSTVSLLGSALLGLAALRRKLG
jgi:endo-1,4-beta-xylanase